MFLSGDDVKALIRPRRIPRIVPLSAVHQEGFMKGSRHRGENVSLKTSGLMEWIWLMAKCPHPYAYQTLQAFEIASNKNRLKINRGALFSKDEMA